MKYIFGLVASSLLAYVSSEFYRSVPSNSQFLFAFIAGGVTLLAIGAITSN